MDMTNARVTSIHGGSQRGFALIYVALIMTLLLLCAGLAVDSGRAYMVKAQLTKAVDGAARMLNSANPRNQAVQIFNANFPPGYSIQTGEIQRPQRVSSPSPLTRSMLSTW